VSPAIPSGLTLSTDLALHTHATGEVLPMRMPTFQPAGNPMEVYRIAAGFYCSGDSNAWIVPAQQFGQFMEIQASGHFPLGLLQIFSTHETASLHPVKDALLERIRARRDAIKSRKGILSASYPLIREDREDR